jgi:hypothetical protein
MDARIAMAESIAEEMDMDLSPEFLEATDKVLVQLYLRGYLVTRDPDQSGVDP